MFKKFLCRILKHKEREYEYYESIWPTLKGQKFVGCTRCGKILSISQVLKDNTKSE